MAFEKLSAEDVRKKTQELLGADADYSYITDDLVAADQARSGISPEGGDEVAPNTVWYGNNARYGANGNTYGYFFENDCNGAPDGCSTACTGWVPFTWHHQYLGQCSSGRERWSFTS